MRLQDHSPDVTDKYGDGSCRQRWWALAVMLLVSAVALPARAAKPRTTRTQCAGQPLVGAWKQVYNVNNGKFTPAKKPYFFVYREDCTALLYMILPNRPAMLPGTWAVGRPGWYVHKSKVAPILVRVVAKSSGQRALARLAKGQFLALRRIKSIAQSVLSSAAFDLARQMAGRWQMVTISRGGKTFPPRGAVIKHFFISDMRHITIYCGSETFERAWYLKRDKASGQLRLISESPISSGVYSVTYAGKTSPPRLMLNDGKTTLTLKKVPENTTCRTLK